MVLTGAFDHVSTEHPWFQSACAHAEDECGIDLESTDSESGKITLAVRLGDARTRVLYQALVGRPPWSGNFETLSNFKSSFTPDPPCAPV